MDRQPAYCFIAWDADVTGRRLIDEICQLAAYTPAEQFRQYIMPHGEVGIVSRKRHFIKTVSNGKFRVLRDTRAGGKVLKTKSELYALNDFVEWLEKVKGQSAGVVLLSFEKYKLAPTLLIDALKRRLIFNRFCGTVSGFINVYPFIKEKCESSMTSFSLKTLSKVLLNREYEDTYSAHDRARITYEVLKHLCAGDSTNDNENISVNLEPLLSSIGNEELELEKLKYSLGLQNTLRPIFYPLFADRTKRRRASILRKLLVKRNVGFYALQNFWFTGQESLEEFVFTVLYDEPKRDAREVLDIIVTYFKNQDKVVNKSPPEENASQCKSEEENKTDKAVNDLTGQMDLLSTEENKPKTQTNHASEDNEL